MRTYQVVYRIQRQFGGPYTLASATVTAGRPAGAKRLALAEIRERERPFRVAGCFSLTQVIRYTLPSGRAVVRRLEVRA